LDQMAKVNVLITDKTGTLTEGKPSLDTIVAHEEGNENLILKLAAALNQNSEHPLANAVLHAFKKEHSTVETVEEFENISGKGIKGSTNSARILLGNEALLHEFKISVPERLKQKVTAQQDLAKTVSYISKDDEVLGFLAFSDKIKPSSKHAINYLQRNNVEVIMMTGDNEHTAKAVSNELGIKKFHAEQLPQDKLEMIKSLQQATNVVAMTGDGINDAPALAQSDVGISMGTGSDVAIESSEITLLKGDLLGVAKAQILSR